jgi:hypothetical protein
MGARGENCTLFADGANPEFSAGVGIGLKGLIDEHSGVVFFKSGYMIPTSRVALAFFSNGGDVILKRGYALEIEPARN